MHTHYAGSSRTTRVACAVLASIASFALLSTVTVGMTGESASIVFANGAEAMAQAFTPPETQHVQ